MFTDAEGIKLVGKLNPVISAAMMNQERDGFTYNKDAGRFICPRGRMSEKGTERHPEIMTAVGVLTVSMRRDAQDVRSMESVIKLAQNPVYIR